MKRARRYAAKVLLVVIPVALLPLALVKIALDFLFEEVVGNLDFLEAIADDE
jgi:hypothetical protein